jgi:hypothetical protein
LTNRFDNISTDDLLARELETRAELRELQDAVRARLIAEAKERIEIGKVYRVVRLSDDRWQPRLEGRLILVEGINAGIMDALHHGPYRTWAWGRLNGKSDAGDGWTIKRQNVGVERLEPV